jgi:hypothetical protein
MGMPIVTELSPWENQNRMALYAKRIRRVCIMGAGKLPLSGAKIIKGSVLTIYTIVPIQSVGNFFILTEARVG